MKAEETKKINIELSGEEADKFKSAIKKITEQECKTGFTYTSGPNVMTPDERSLISDINREINK